MILNSDFIFVIGAPRSGTTWLQILLSEKQGVYTNLENTLFANYIAPLEQKWELEKSSKFNKGLPKIMNEKFWSKWLQDLIESTYLQFIPESIEISEKKLIILDKNPGNVFQVKLIQKYLPQSKFIHIVRDGRDVIASSLNAKKNIGFGYGDVREGSLQWVKRVETGRSYVGQENYFEVRYEDLLSSTLETLMKVYDFLKWEIDIQKLQNIISENDFEKNRDEGKTGNKNIKATKGFYNKGKAGSWKTDLTTDQKYLIHVIAGEQLRKLNYVNDEVWWCNNFIMRFITKVKFKFKKIVNAR